MPMFLLLDDLPDTRPRHLSEVDSGHLSSSCQASSRPASGPSQAVLTCAESVLEEPWCARAVAAPISEWAE